MNASIDNKNLIYVLLFSFEYTTDLQILSIRLGIYLNIL